MNVKSSFLLSAVALLAASFAQAQITITSPNTVYLNGAATPSMQVPLGTYAWTRTASIEGLYQQTPPAGYQPTAEAFATTPVIDPTFANAAIRELTVPPEFEGRVWGTPPLVNHPTALAAAPDGTLYVAVDGNGSLSGFAHLGRIVRLRDTNKDGEVDEAKLFVADVDSPRGVIWDHDHLIVMAPPNVTAYYDRDGDGVSEEKKILISGMGWPVSMALADHSIQNIEVGIDGWVYLAVGDIGVFGAKGSDGRTLQMRGGGIVRFHSDGSGMELFATGTRNNYGVSISPLLDVFSRDNTNDGGGWNVRLHHFTGLTDAGYPSLWQNFPDEAIAPLADFGGGSGVGQMWLDEPSIPEKWRGLTTADYGQRALFHHELIPKGATFTVPGYTGGESAAKPALRTPGEQGAPTGNEPFIGAVNPMDADVDANGNIYLAAWRNGGFTWTGPVTGLVYKISPKNYTAPPLPDFDRISAAALVEVLNGPSNVRRIEAQRAILRRKAELGTQVAPMLETLAADRSKPLANRIAALFTDKQLRGAGSMTAITRLASDPTIAAWAIRALGDDQTQARALPLETVTGSLKSSDPRTRKEALIALARANSVASAPLMTPLLADPDTVVQHTAQQALRSLRAVDASLAVVDSPASSPTARKYALFVLESIHEARVTDALELRLGRETDASRRADLVGTLARLASTEPQWNGSWWNVRPSNVGPYFAPSPWEQTPKIMAALNAALDKAGPDETLAIGRQFVKQGVAAGPAVNKFLAFADTEPALVPQITSYFSTADEIPANALPVLTKAANTATNAANVRTEAAVALSRSADRTVWPQLLSAATSIGQGGAAAGRGGVVPVGPAAPAPSAIQQMLITSIDANPAVQAQLQARAAARTAIVAAALTGNADRAAIGASVGAIADAEAALALARADAFAKVQASVAKLSAAQVTALATQSIAAAPASAGPTAGLPAGRGAAAPSPARVAVMNSPRLEDVYPVLIDEAAKLNGESSQLADAALLSIAGVRFGPAAARTAASSALDAGWRDPRRRVQIILAAVTARDASRATQIIAAASDSDAAVARAAQYALQQLNIDPAQVAASASAPKVGTMAVPAVLDAIASTKGSVARGAQLVRELGCVACHSIAAGETLKGPALHLVSGVLPRRELGEAILNPGKTISQGFPTMQITRRAGPAVVGFVVQDSTDMVTLRDTASQLTRIPAADITARRRLDISMMPPGLVGDITVQEFASLLDYLESFK